MGYHCPKRYGLWSIRELWVMLRISRIPTWEMENPMGYKGVWVIRAMGYEGVDCSVSAVMEVVAGGWDQEVRRAIADLTLEHATDRTDSYG
jgi:hypothetical protein